MLGRWLVSLAEGDFEMFRHHLAVPHKHESELAFTSEDDGPTHGTLFCRPGNKGKSKHLLNIRQKKLIHPEGERWLNPPLCGGYVRFSPRLKGEAEFRDSRSAELHLSLNLQRFIRHQPQHASPVKGNEPSAKPRLTKRKGDRSFFGEEFSFDGQDNWIPDTPAWTAFANPKKSRLHLAAYLKKITRVFHQQAKRAAKFAEGGAGWKTVKRALEYHSLSTVETGWEFASLDPIGDVLQIGNSAMRLRKKAEQKNYLIQLGKSGWELNSPCLIFLRKRGRRK